MSSTMSQKKKESKRKITDEGQLFSEKWTDDYFFVEAKSKVLHLICREFGQVFKVYTLKDIICKNVLPNPVHMKNCVKRTKYWN